jgi:cell wall-associated NlpC family hydrolase
MELTLAKGHAIVHIALWYVDTPYSTEFTCIDFVREVYQFAGIELPELGPMEPPPGWNLRWIDLDNPPIGHTLFLKHKRETRKRAWSHVVIIMPDRHCIHCSLLCGGKVMISSLDDLLTEYNLIE